MESTNTGKPSGLSKKSERIPSEQRKHLVCEAALSVFSEHGYAGTRTSMIAKQAGVSEALIFRHYPNKEALFEAAINSVIDAKDLSISRLLQYLSKLKPSTKTFIQITHSLIYLSVIQKLRKDGPDIRTSQLLIQSLLGSGGFARSYLEQKCGEIPILLERSMIAARESGDLIGTVSGKEIAWCIHNFSFGYFVSHLSDHSVFNFEVDENKMLFQVVEMILIKAGLNKKCDQFGIDFDIPSLVRKVFNES